MRLLDLLRRPVVLAAIIALVVGHVVMVLIMTMTPLHMTSHGHDLAAVGFVISGHTFGMFALSPLSGRLTDRFGSPPGMLAGLGVIGASALLSALAPPEGGILLFVALFLLGYGWRMGYVVGSALLSSGLTLAERTRIQGATDAMIWSFAAAASLPSGLVVAVAGYTALGLLGTGMVVIPAWIVLQRHRGAVATALRALRRGSHRGATCHARRGVTAGAPATARGPGDWQARGGADPADVGTAAPRSGRERCSTRCSWSRRSGHRAPLVAAGPRAEVLPRAKPGRVPLVRPRRRSGGSPDRRRRRGRKHVDADTASTRLALTSSTTSSGCWVGMSPIRPESRTPSGTS